MVAFIIEALGVRSGASLDDVDKIVASGKIFWLDVAGETDAVRLAYLEKLGFDQASAAPALRFGQAGRLRIAKDGLRGVTWIADREGNLVELHLVSSGQGLVSLWTGEAVVLDPVRNAFSDHICCLGGDVHYAAAILLELLLGTLDASIQRLDADINDLRLKLDREQGAVVLSLVSQRIQQVESLSASFSRYAGAVRSAMVGIETALGVGPRAAAELNDYVDLVEDFEQQAFERRRWLSDAARDLASAIAQRQSDQISRLTVVSMIFLPVTAVVSFFGTNFDWLDQRIASEQAFLVYGVGLTVLTVVGTIMWLARRGLMRLGGGLLKIRLWRSRAPAAAAETAPIAHG